ncbi:response regulator transcription factor [Mucilaginibacter kameinonensis]|uniref:response regulator transcription factor n=1 Tax=Mucilaginibacter kameinonensis TaxID=452286 RepID=UPI000EF7D44F|nr:response regulator transcription factor [Mucilaginibacter kameinonensis]
MKTISIVIVDDHILFAKSLEILIKGFPEYSVLFCCSDGVDLTRKISQKLKPDIVLLDQNMPNMDGLETVTWLKQNYPDIKILVLSMNHTEDTVLKMVRSGINGYILKDSDINIFKNALDTVSNDNYYYPRFVNNYLIGKTKSSDTSPNVKNQELKDHEIEFIKLAASELTYKEIADQMLVSLRTVDGYRDQLFKKLELKNRVGLVLYAIKCKII